MGVQSGASDLLSTFRHAAHAEDSAEALSTLVLDCVKQTSAMRGDMYLLELSNTRLALAFSSDPVAVKEKFVSVNPSLLRKADWRFRKAFETKRPAYGAEDASGRGDQHLFVPIVRENACLGVIRLVPRSRSFESDDIALTQLVAQLAAFLIEKKHTLQLLTVMEKRFNFQQPRDEFLDELMLLAAEASGFPYVVLRELDEDHSVLECIRSYGFSNLTLASLNIAPLSRYPLFEAAIATRSTQVLSGNLVNSTSVITDIVDREELQRVVIVPVIVGGAVFGTASFSVACDHNITTLEQRGLEAIANCVGGAIANYRNVGLAHEVFFERAKAAAAFTTVDVAQAARHEARNFIHNAQTNLATLLKLLTRLQSRSKLDVNALIDDIFNDLSRVDLALDKIKAITRPVDDRAKEIYPLDTLWSEAIELVGGRLRAMNVRYTIRGKVAIECIPDLLRHAFLQLVLNSIDSFKDSPVKRGHQITVLIEEHESDVSVKYLDNGVGVDVTKLMGRDFQGAPRVADIFLPGVTTKAGGSGYGLYLVRRALDAHHGSIDLVDYRNCMTFKIVLKKQLGRGTGHE
jgi:signal transduction histidine kinase